MAEKSFDALLYQALLEAGWQENRTAWEGTEGPAGGRGCWQTPLAGGRNSCGPCGPRPCGQRPASCWPPP